MNITGFSFRPDESHDWVRDAACGEPDAPYMFPHEQDHAGIDMAKRTCAGCPVQPTCLAVALANNEGYGVWGGLTADERRQYRRREARRNSVRNGKSEAA